MTITITTTKGGITGTIEEVIAWQTQHQGAMETIKACGVSVDATGIEWGLDGEREAVLSLISDELLMSRVRTADHIEGEDADEGLVIEVIDADAGVVLVAWDQGIRSRSSVLDLIAD